MAALATPQVCSGEAVDCAEMESGMPLPAPELPAPARLPPGDLQDIGTCSNPSLTEGGGDEEMGMAQPAPLAVKPAETTGVKVRSPRCARRWCCNACLLFVVLSVVMGVTFRAREPDWELTALDIDTARFARVMMGMESASRPLSLVADVAFHNPNFVGSSLEPGAVQVYLDGDLMASGTTSACSVAPQATSAIQAYVTMESGDAINQKILDTVKKNDFKLRIVAEARLLARVGPLKVKTDVTCEVLADASMVMKEKPRELLVEKKCSYKYSI